MISFAAFDQGQSIVKAALPLAFSLLCPCFVSLHLPQAALDSAPFHEKRKSGAKKAEKRVWFSCESYTPFL